MPNRNHERSLSLGVNPQLHYSPGSTMSGGKKRLELLALHLPPNHTIAVAPPGCQRLTYKESGGKDGQ